MARRTKQDALATRHALLDAAERVFQRKGVSASSLNDIASEAGATRGAIYWHFKDKADLYNAMLERVSLPLEQAMAQARQDDDPLASMHAAILSALENTVKDARTRRVFEVATLKVEYVDSLCAVRQRRLMVRGELLRSMRAGLLDAARMRGKRLAIPAESAACGLYSLMDGLIQNWLLDSEQFDLQRTGRKVLDAYLAGLGLSVMPDARRRPAR